MEQEVTAADPSQGHPQMGGKLKGRSAFLLHPSPFHIPVVQAACISFLAYGFPTWPPSSPVVFKWADFASQGIFFFFLMIKRMLLISSGYRSGMVIKSYNAQHSPSSPTKNSLDQNVSSAQVPVLVIPPQWVFNSAARVTSTF